MWRNNKAQITLFIIIVIIVIIAVSLILYVNSETSRSSESNFDILSDVQPIKIYINSCLEKTTEDALQFISLQGGYYDVMDPKTDEIGISIPYHYFYGENYLPDKSLIENEFSNYVKNKLNLCLNNFENFRNAGFEFDIGDLSIKTTLGNKILVEINYPIKITKQDSVTSIENFYVRKDINFDRLYNFLLNFEKEHNKNPDYVPIGYLSLLAYKKDFVYDLTYMSDNSVMYSFLIYNLSKEDESLLFNFAAKYNWSEINPNKNIVAIEPIPSKTAYPDYEFKYQVNANKDLNVKFSDYSHLFKINENTGLINFTPQKEDEGTHFIMIRAFDNDGNEDTKIMELNIISENEPPNVENIKDAEINIGEVFNYIINASDPDKDTLFFYAESSLANFNLNPLTGDITFIPQEGQQGNYTITIIVIDTHVELTITNFNIEIK